MFKEDEQFDLKIRSILDEGREEVPGRLWDSISSRLDESVHVAAPVQGHTGRRPLVVRLRNAGIGLAAAAAVAVSVVFSGVLNEEEPGMPSESTLAVLEPSARDSVPDYAILLAQLSRTEAEALDAIKARTVFQDVASSEEVLSDDMTYLSEEAPAGEQGKKTPAQEREPSVKEEAGASWNGEFPDIYDDEKPSRKIRASLTLFGNAVSNSNSQRSAETGFMTSPSLPSVNTVEEKSESRYGIPVSFGAGVRLGFTPRWSMSIGLNYTFLSRTFDGNFVDAEKGVATWYSDIRNTQNYIGIPVNVYFNILKGDFVDFYAYAGGSAEYCLTNKYYLKGNTGSFTHNGNADTFQFSANAGIGVEFILARHLGFYIDPSLRYYFQNSSAPKSIRTAQPLMLGFEAGFRIRL